MKEINNNSYYNKNLDFYIEKPEEWIFVPQQWALNFKGKNLEEDSQIKENLHKATIPFVFFYKFHDEQEYAYPTVQCSFRLNNGNKIEEDFKNLLEMFPKMFSEFEISEATPDFIFNGYRAIYIKTRFTLRNIDGITLNCLGRTFAVYKRNYIINIGLTGSVEPKYQCEEEFQQIIQSIKTG